MSLWVLQSDFLNFKPRTWVERDCLISRTTFLGQALRLFAFSKKVIVDRGSETVTIKRRILWLFHTTKEISFREISRIDYSYAEFMTSWDFFVGATDQLEFFSVSLVLGDPMYDRKYKLWTFWGEGSVATGLGGWLMGDSALDYSGSQERQSRDYVSLLQEYTGKPLT